MNVISRPKDDFSAQFVLVNTVDYSYFQENLQYNDHSAILKPLEQPQIEKNLQIECMTLRLESHNFNFEVR